MSKKDLKSARQSIRESISKLETALTVERERDKDNIQSHESIQRVIKCLESKLQALKGAS